MLRRLTEDDDVLFTVECLPEDIPIEVNASAIDDETDAATDKWILDELDAGNTWAWATVIVRARWNGFEGRDVLGCCSYESEAAFEQPGGYFDDMKQQALADLNAQTNSKRFAPDSSYNHSPTRRTPCNLHWWTSNVSACA